MLQSEKGIFNGVKTTYRSNRPLLFSEKKDRRDILKKLFILCAKKEKKYLSKGEISGSLNARSGNSLYKRVTNDLETNSDSISNELARFSTSSNVSRLAIAINNACTT